MHLFICFFVTDFVCKMYMSLSALFEIFSHQLNILCFRDTQVPGCSSKYLAQENLYVKTVEKKQCFELGTNRRPPNCECRTFAMAIWEFGNINSTL